MQQMTNHKWVTSALERLNSYLYRAPIMAKVIISQEGVFIVLINQKEKNFFPYEYELDPKVWIHNIKNWLVDFYPYVQELKANKKIVWRIDKVIQHRSMFLVKKEGELDNGKFRITETPEMKRFLYTENISVFLKKYRFVPKRYYIYKDLTETSKLFFSNAIPLDNVSIRNS